MPANIKHDFSYLSSSEKLKTMGLQKDVVGKIAIEVKSEMDAIEFLDYLESHYKLYQYKKDNDVKYGEHELFFWKNENYRYFTVDINHMLISDDVVVDDLLKQKIVAIDGVFIRLQYTTIPIIKTVEQYIDTLSISSSTVNDFNWEAFRYICSLIYYCNGYKFSKGFRDKVLSIENQMFSILENCTVTATLSFASELLMLEHRGKISGKIKSVGNGQWGFFKGQSKKRYYPITAINIINAIVGKSKAGGPEK